MTTMDEPPRSAASRSRTQNKRWLFLSTPLDPNIVEAGHILAHHLPLAATGERGRWSVGNRVENRVDLGARGERHGLEKANGRHLPPRVICAMPLKKVD